MAKETMKGKTLLKGHTLIGEGDCFEIISGRAIYKRNGTDGLGRCSCGQFSPLMPSRNARKLWHREHKEEIRKSVAGGQK